MLRLPDPVTLRKNAIALTIGTIGGALFFWLKLPLAWMLGAMTATAVLALAGADIAVAPPLRNVMIMVLGVLLGSSFTPQILNHLGGWVGGIALLAVYLPLTTFTSYVFFRKIGKLSPVTAYFSATPGGLNEMVMVGRALGGDTPVIALIHAIRIFMVVMLIPAFFLLVEHVTIARGAIGPGIANTDPWDALMLIACGLIGGPVAKRMNLPAALLMGPMIVSAAIHLGGLTTGRPPWEAVAAAQVAIGAGLGCRFAGLKLSRIGKTMMLSAISTVLMLGIGLAFTYALHDIAGSSFEGVLLAYAPGGLAEMSLVALSLGVDTAYVASMHLVRVIVVIFMAPTIWKRIFHPRIGPK